MIHTSIVIPTYNERENIELLLKQWKLITEKRQEKLEIIVVDDNSPDGTADAVRKFSAEFEYLRVIKSESRKGISAAWVCGCEQSGPTFNGGFRNGLREIDFCFPAETYHQLLGCLGVSKRFQRSTGASGTGSGDSSSSSSSPSPAPAPR